MAEGKRRLTRDQSPFLVLIFPTVLQDSDLKLLLLQNQIILASMGLDLWEGWEVLHQWQLPGLGISHFLLLLVV
jgi:hypothetical protein